LLFIYLFIFFQKETMIILVTIIRKREHMNKADKFWKIVIIILKIGLFICIDFGNLVRNLKRNKQMNMNKQTNIQA